MLKSFVKKLSSSARSWHLKNLRGLCVKQKTPSHAGRGSIVSNAGQAFDKMLTQQSLQA